MSTVVVPAVWSTAQPSPTTKLVKKVIRTYGYETDAELEEIALDALDDTVKDMNSHTYEFNLVQATITLTASEDEYTLPTQFFKEKLSRFREKSTSNDRSPMRYIDWANFNRIYNLAVAAPAMAEAYTLRNVHNDGKVRLSSSPTASTASDYDLVIDYYRRIQLPSEQKVINVPQEIENALLFGAQMRFAIHIVGAAHPDVGSFQQLHMMAVEDLQEIDRKHPDELTRFRLADWDRGRVQGKRPGTIFIRI